MASIVHNDKRIAAHSGETVLEVLLRNGIDARFSCRSGTCQTCLMKSDGEVSAESQKGLAQDLIDKNYFMPCVCRVSNDMTILPKVDSEFFHTATIYERNRLSDDVIQIKLEVGSDFPYRPGQYINVKYKDTDEVRSYSLASLPMVDTFLEIQVKKVKGGKVSSWIFDELNVGEEIKISNALGSSFYDIEDKQKNLLLVGTGTGLSPLLGIIRDALTISSHQGNIYLYHGGSVVSDLYLQKELRDLDTLYNQFHYFPCVSSGNVPLGHKAGRANMIAFSKHKDLAGWEVYLAGNPEMVKDGSAVALSFGVLNLDLHTDAFEFENLRGCKGAEGNSNEQSPYELRDEESHYPEPDLEMWSALKEGELLTEILTEFYGIVFSDSRLKPFFSHVTQQRLIEKQYNFLYQTFTGKKVYFGATIRNAHHWMVISDELFDYRADILEGVMRRHGLPDHLVERWCAFEETARPKITKSKPWDKILDGKAVQLDRFEETTMEVPSICDSCHGEVKPGERIRYHLRLGKVFCNKCAGVSNESKNKTLLV